MKEFDIPIERKETILALGPESAGNFCIYENGKVYYEKDLGDLIEENNFENYKKVLLDFLDKNNLKPDIICTDLHPEYKTTILGQELAERFNAKPEKVQHHVAHIYSVLFDQTIRASIPQPIPQKFIGIACDGTGYGVDDKIWGGEILKLEIRNWKLEIDRVGHLENQLLCGGDLAIKQPARMLLSILLGIKQPKEVWSIFSAFYSEQEFNTLVKMHEQKFNSLETSSTGRILDAASFLLGFCSNERKYKHEPVDLLERNSTEAFDLQPRCDKQDEQDKCDKYILNTSYLFEWLLDNLDKDKGRLAATVQRYIMDGLIQIAKSVDPNLPIYFGGGMANNKIMSQIAKENGIIMSDNIERGDYGMSLGQLMYYLRSDKL